jgi:hypothetical protein
MLASQRGHFEVTKLLLAAGGDVHAQNEVSMPKSICQDESVL